MDGTFDFDYMMGRSRPMTKIYRLIEQVANIDIPVLIYGESGTGKELVAKAIHRLSRRRGGPFIAINTGAIAKDLIESELFGHEKGSFTGANMQKKGKFEAASDGVLFLDEISTMSENTQVSLLRVLETKKFQRIGGTKDIKTDARIIAAVNEDLDVLIKEGKFRTDLYHRLNVFRINLPPLRERREDIGILVNHFIDRYSREFGKQVDSITEEALDMLKLYSWPGNVRELENIIMRMCITSGENVLSEADIPEIVKEEKEKKESINLKVGVPLEEVEKQLIMETLKTLDGKKTEAAKLLGISRKALYNKLKDYGFNEA